MEKNVPLHRKPGKGSTSYNLSLFVEPLQGSGLLVIHFHRVAPGVIHIKPLRGSSSYINFFILSFLNSFILPKSCLPVTEGAAPIST